MNSVPPPAFALEPAEIARRRLLAARIRAQLVRMSHAAGAPHLGSALSCVDLLVGVYWGDLHVDPARADAEDRDRFILSKGHAAAALYAVLAERGFFDESLLDTYGRDGTRLPEQMSPGCLPGIEAATGSLGHGLPLAAGMALAARIQQRTSRMWVVLSDGECNEGSVWEAAMFAAGQKLHNLIALVDYNGWQATGRSDEVLALAPLKEKWQAFGWNACEIDGHDISAVAGALHRAVHEPGDRPTCIVARTVKGRGVSFMEDDNNWHYRVPSADEVLAAMRELGQVSETPEASA